MTIFRKSFQERNPVVIGAIGLAVIALTCWPRSTRRTCPIIGGGTTYHAAVQPRQGRHIKPGDEVTIAGVSAARSPGRSSRATTFAFSFRLKGKQHFGTASGAEIRIKTVLGAMYFGGRPGWARQLSSHTEIPLNRTKSADDVVDGVQ